MDYVINMGYSRRLLVPMTDKTSAAIKELFDCTYAEERYVQGEGQCYDLTDDYCNIEVVSDEKVDEQLSRAVQHPK